MRPVSKSLIMVSSITYAMKGRDLLQRRGFRAYVERAPRGAEDAGCGYGIYVPDRTEEAVELLKEARIPVKGFRERGRV